MYTEDKGINKLCLETLENIKLPISIISTILIEYLMPLSTYKVKKSDKTNFKKELEEINKILSKNSDEIMKEFTLTKTRKELKKKLPLGVDKLVTDKMLKSMLNEEWPKLKKDLNI
ncbi:MAG: hypothetical protein O7C60_03575 [Rickettsia endosymbiont of Ixodes persulcatus]|nr:hypothetical protein [Rickettsia endosymbiont of Ixodes persulcatus]